MASLYPPQYLVLPLHAQERLPPVLQSVDLEVVMVFHSVLALITSSFWVHQPWALPLSLFGLVASMPALLTGLLPHFLAFWIASIPMDVVWLIHRSDQARSIVITMMGINMCFKIVSAGQAARALQAHGAIPDVGVGSSSFGASARPGQPWLGGGTTAPFGLPGSWGGQPQQAPYRDSQHSAPGGAAASTPYRSIYDEEARADEGDAPQVHVDNIASKVAAAAAAAGAGPGDTARGAPTSQDGTQRAQYSTMN